jgi:copper chaperone CopZ
MNPPGANGPDMLTRTTLRIDTAISALSVSELKRALQRVPGVLLAEIDGSAGRATVAHDSAVQMTSLFDAVAANGAHASVVTEPRAPAVSGGVAPPLAAVPIQRLLLVATLVLVLPLFGTLNPSLAKNHLLIPIVLSFVWAVVVARAVFRHRT